MNPRSAIQSQYLAALEMLKHAIVKCPDTLWNDETDKNHFWLLAYHTIFYTHLYLQPTEKDFTMWKKGRPTGELCERLWTKHQIEIGWVGMKQAEA